LKKILSIVLVGSVLFLTGCSPANENTLTEVSRVRSFNSAEELRASSDLIVVGKVVDQKIVNDLAPESPITVSTFAVQGVTLGTPTKTLRVRQFQVVVDGQESYLLEIGKSYLLYLTSTGLKGAMGRDYYVTGVDSGIYEENGTTAAGRKYVRKSHLPGDKLPETVSESELAK